MKINKPGHEASLYRPVSGCLISLLQVGGVALFRAEAKYRTASKCLDRGAIFRLFPPIFEGNYTPQ